MRSNITISGVYHPVAGVSQVDINLGTGGEPAMPFVTAMGFFIPLSRVHSVHTTTEMWKTGRLEIVLEDRSCHELPPTLRRQLMRACRKVIAAG